VDSWGSKLCPVESILLYMIDNFDSMHLGKWRTKEYKLNKFAAANYYMNHPDKWYSNWWFPAKAMPQ
jgi:hypothetical protein